MRRAAVDPVLVGLEHEYRVHDGDTRVDFRTLIHRIGFAGVRADPADPNAYRLPWGGVVTCDGREAEIAIPPVPLRGGFTGRVAQLVAAGHQALECQLPDGHELSGYSTHLSVSAPRRGDCRLARRYASTFAPALMLLMDRADSPGLLVRPRPGRLELCGEYVRGPQLRGALAFAAGSAMAAGAANRRALNALRIDVALAPAVERYGWYVDRSAFGVDLYHGGRDTHLRRLRGGTITAQDHLEATWTIARDALAPSANLIDLAATDALVNARAPLPLEQPCDQPIDECGDHLGAAETSAGVDIGPRLNKYLPTVHGFDEFFGYLYHLDAMSDPFWYSYPTDAAFRDKFGPRDLVHCWATDKDDDTDMPRWGKVGKQKIVDEGPLRPFKNMANRQRWHEEPKGGKYDMETFDEVLVEQSKAFMDKAKKEGKPFFLWHNTTRMHVFTYLADKYQAEMNYKTNYGLEEAGMAQLDDSVGAIMKHLDEIGEADNTLLVFSTDNGAEVFTWPDGGMTPFKATKGTVMEGGFRVPCIARWPNHIKAGTVENGLFSGLDWFPTMVAAAGNPNVTDDLLKGVKLGDRTYKNHLDGYDQLDLLQGKGPSKRHELFYFGGPQLGAVRIDDFKYQFYQQPQGWPGPKVTTDMPSIVNLRQDPFERTPSLDTIGTNNMGGGYMNDFYAREFWRFVFVQQRVAELAKTAVDYPPMQDPASFNLEAIKKKIDAVIREHHGQ